MRIVHTPDALAEAIAGAKRESLAAFGDDQLLLEKYLTGSRHVEIQVFADTHGHCIYLFERDCSLQRRHQKVVEEAPAPNLSTDTRRRMGEAAVAAARAVNYVGAGTVEFLYADNTFYFIEMNTRLQVEHPVTEMITGLDLVEWQLRVAAGEPLPLEQGELFAQGHAFEARLYAEDPERDFLPAAGRLVYVDAPAASEHVRVDTGVRAGDEIGTFYDPMIAKLIVWGEDRSSALRQLRQALAAYTVVGVTTNIGFLQRIAGHPTFEQAAIDTDFIPRHRRELLTDVSALPERVLALGAVATLLMELAARRAASGVAITPWQSIAGWQPNQDYYQDVSLWHAGTLQKARVQFAGSTYQVRVPSGASFFIADPALAGQTLLATIDNSTVRVVVVASAGRLCLVLDGTGWWLERDDPVARATLAETGNGHLRAPMPGKVIALLVQPGQSVQANQPVMILEAMKMEHTIVAPAAGNVSEVRFAEGDRVTEGEELLVIEIADGVAP
jgi:3-methylcrotonyl-CoA carboxylase alpha subunit